MTIYQDFIDLLQSERGGHLTNYVYFGGSKIYDGLVNSGLYYPSRVEHELLDKKTIPIIQDCGYFDQILEVGPGSRDAVILKTISFIKNAKCISRYIALDISKLFASDACRVVKEYFPGIKVLPIEYNFSLTNKVTRRFLKSSNYNNCLCFFGGTLSNLEDDQIIFTLKNFQNLILKGDYLLFGVDLNKNLKSLETAYNNEWMKKLIFNIMSYFKKKLSLKDFDVNSFKFDYYWNEKKSRVELSLIAQKTQQVIIKGQEFHFNKGHKYHVVNSRKFTKKEILALLKKSGLEIINMVDSDPDEPQFCLILARKL